MTHPDVRRYLASLPPKSRRAVNTLRTAIRAIAKGLDESVTYGIPTFKYEGQRFIYVAGWRTYVSIYPVTAGMKKAGGATIKKHQTGPGTLRFELDAPLPMAFIKKLVRARLKEVRAR